MMWIDALESRRLFAVTWSNYAKLIGQDVAASQYASLSGSGETVAVIDTGIDYKRPELGGGFGAGKKVVAGYDFVDNDSDPMDVEGHGTMVASMIAGNRFTQNNITYQGIAPGANLVALRAGDENGNFSDTNIIAALNWVATNQGKYHITVVNMSLGGDSSKTATTEAGYADALKKLGALGVTVVAAAGNSGDTSRDTVEYPAADPAVFAIGSVTAAGQISDFSERGQELDLLAPGEQVTTTKMGGGYETVDGTSFSSPLVAGVFALLKQQTKQLSPGDMMSVLRSSSTTQYDGDGDGGRTTQRAYAQLNLPAALALAKVRDAAAPRDNFPARKDSTFDIAYDKSGDLHLAYYDAATRKLMYAVRLTNDEWTAPTVIDNGDDVGQYLSLAIDPTGKAGVSYYDGRNQDLKFASFDGSKWNAVTLDSKGSVGQFTSLAYTSDGDAYVAYYRRTSGDLKLASYDRATKAWTRTTIDNAGDVGQYASIGAVRDASTNASGQNFETIAIAYADSTNGDLKYYRKVLNDASSDAELRTVVDNLSGVAHISLAFADGAVRIGYQDSKNSDVKFAYRTNSVFKTKVVASEGAVGSSIDSFVDSDGNYHIVYYNKSKKATYDAKINDQFFVLGTGRVAAGGQYGVVSATPSGSAATFLGFGRTGSTFDDKDLF